MSEDIKGNDDQAAADLNETDQAPPEDMSSFIRRAAEVVSNAKSMPLSASVLISRDEVMSLLDKAMQAMPNELRQARWMLREREEYLAKSEREAERILESARAQAERMVQRTEIARQAEHNAQRTMEAARDEASRLRNEAEDYCDQKLAAFEIVLERTAKLVQAGREKLQGIPTRDNGRHTTTGSRMAGKNGTVRGASRAPDDDPGSQAEEAFFDQDRRF